MCNNKCSIVKTESSAFGIIKELRFAQSLLPFISVLKTCLHRLAFILLLFMTTFIYSLYVLFYPVDLCFNLFYCQCWLFLLTDQHFASSENASQIKLLIIIMNVLQSSWQNYFTFMLLYLTIEKSHPYSIHCSETIFNYESNRYQHYMNSKWALSFFLDLFLPPNCEILSLSTQSGIVYGAKLDSHANDSLHHLSSGRDRICKPLCTLQEPALAWTKLLESWKLRLSQNQNSALRVLC